MTLFISIVSHLHHDVIINLGTIKRLSQYENVVVVCRDNKPINKLQLYCDKYGVNYLPNVHEQGFAANNNQNFLYCQNNLGMKSSDLFLLLNPDVEIDDDGILQLISMITNEAPKLATCNLYLDREYMMADDNIRLYPTFTNFIKTYLLNDRATMVDRKNGFVISKKHWASAAFLLVESALYSQLKGLDESYYMYCEDIDFCYRAKKSGYDLCYLETLKAVHFRRRYSKRFMSKYFFWHVASVFRYSFVRKKAQAKKSCLIGNQLN